jgi:hypothetical protein
MPVQRALLKNIPIYTLGFLVVGILMGGMYSLPAMKITRSKEPWFTLFLSFGLTITVTAIGLLFFKSNMHITYAIMAANILLIIRRCFGKLDNNVERFGIIHVISLIGCFWYVLLIERTNS